MKDPIQQLYEMGMDVAAQTNAMLAYWDRDLICRFANNAYLEWFGIAPDQMIGKITLPELLGPLYALNRLFVEGVLNGKMQVFERNIETPAGEIRNSIATYRPHISEGQVLGFYVHVADVTHIFVNHSIDSHNSAIAGAQPATDLLLKDLIRTLKLSLVSGFPGISHLAAKHYTSESTLKRIFKEKFQTTIFVYYRKLQMELAAHYLDEVKMTRKEVAAMLKFANPSNFSACYKRYQQENNTLKIITTIRAAYDERYRTFIAQSPFAIAMLDRELRYLAFSQRWVSEYALGSADIMGRLHFDMLPQSAGSWDAIFQECLAGASRAGETSYSHPAGSGTRWLKYDIRPWYDTFNEIGGIMVFNEDITEQKMKEEENRRIFEILSKTSEIARIGAWKRNFINNTRTWSKITREILEVADDYDPDLDEVLLFYKEGKSRELATKAIENALVFGRPFDIEAHIVTKKGTEKKVRVIGYPEFINGKCEKLMGIFQDITKHATNVNGLALEEIRR